MPGKSSAGFIKAANQDKFVRNRDVKLKDVEVKKEANIQRLMCEGVCNKCRAKVQWRFQFNKYKPLTKIANCQSCKQKCVTKAYRTMCDKCACAKKACSSCCEDMETANALYKAYAAAAVDDAETTAADGTKTAGKGAEGTEMAVGDDDEEDEDDTDGGEMEEEADSVRGADERSIADSTVGRSSSSMAAAREVLAGASVGWGDFDERKFAQIAASKYSKDRKIGEEPSSEPGSVFQFDDSSRGST